MQAAAENPTVHPLPSINAEELHAILAEIKANPENWNQKHYAIDTECGTAYCIAGHAVRRGAPGALFAFAPLGRTSAWTALTVILADGEACSIDDLAAQLLGLNETEAAFLFDSGNRLPALERIIGLLTDPGYDRTASYDELAAMTVGA